MKTILVTGSSGLIGSEVSGGFHARGCRVSLTAAHTGKAQRYTYIDA